ncbi:ATPase [Caballeronia sp. LZ043]|uniref:ATPase n=1 Tax=Caballeronia sp. LZ043 TaxID=3038569 RepID=UPI002862E63C|nr:ATPase [Caballeronia sp. LZ043]MDR5826082.1 ATPase [Caballeronia sp. LZ043]
MSIVVENGEDNQLALVALEPGARDAPLTMDVADDGELERELTQMEADADRLQKEGVISTDDANMKRAEVARTRKLFRDLPAAERIAIIKRRREIGRQLLDRQLSGAAVVAARVRLNHTRLKPLFEQWWPYLNRMSINMQRFGQSTFGAEDKDTVNTFFEKQLTSIEGYADEQLRVAEAYRRQKEAELRANKEFVFEPTIPMPAMDIEVEAYSRFSMRMLTAIMKFDRAMDHFDFMVWNGIRDQSDVDDETVRFLKKVNPLGVRGYMTHLRLMTTVRGL